MSSVAALGRLLDELELLVCDISPEAYRARPLSAVSGSVGEHLRHCLDHVSALLDHEPDLVLSYDSRRRGTPVETEPVAALAQILECRQLLALWSWGGLDRPVAVSSAMSPSGDLATTWSTIGREFAFVVNHTIHHQALMAMLLAIQGVRVPERFGLSPSSPRRH